MAVVTQASPCLIPHRQAPTTSSLPPLSLPPSLPPSPLFSAHCCGFASCHAIGLTAAHSPHLPDGIGWRLFPFLHGQGQGTLGCGVLERYVTCLPAHPGELRVPALSPLATPTSPSLLQRKHSGLNYTLQCVASRMPGIKSTDQPSDRAKLRRKKKEKTTRPLVPPHPESQVNDGIQLCDTMTLSAFHEKLQHS